MMVSPSTAVSSALRSEPCPESLVFVAVIVAAWALVGTSSNNSAKMGISRDTVLRRSYPARLAADSGEVAFAGFDDDRLFAAEVAYGDLAAGDGGQRAVAAVGDRPFGAADGRG